MGAREKNLFDTYTEMATLTFCYSSPSQPLVIPKPQSFTMYSSSLSISSKYRNWTHRLIQCSNLNVAEAEAKAETEEEEEEEGEEEGGDGVTSIVKPVAKRKRRQRYRKQYPGEKKGITEEMRFVAMKFRNSKDKKEPESDDGSNDGETWQPSMEGFIKYLVDSKLVFTTIERIVDESSDVSYAYFRRTGLERAECISNDLEWFSQQGHVIPEPSDPGITYANYLEELAEKTPRLFLSHFYNIYFSHIAGGQVIAKKAFERLSEEKELEFYKWEGDEEKLLQYVRENFNMLSKHWSRNDKNKCLREVTKAFRFMGQIVRLIIL